MRDNKYIKIMLGVFTLGLLITLSNNYKGIKLNANVEEYNTSYWNIRDSDEINTKFLDPILSEMGIDNLEDLVEEDLLDITELNLSSMDIDEIPYAINYMDNLEELILDKNNIIYINEDIHDKLMSLSNFSIKGNYLIGDNDELYDRHGHDNFKYNLLDKDDQYSLKVESEFDNLEELLDSLDYDKDIQLVLLQDYEHIIKGETLDGYPIQKQIHSSLDITIPTEIIHEDMELERDYLETKVEIETTTLAHSSFTSGSSITIDTGKEQIRYLKMYINVEGRIGDDLKGITSGKNLNSNISTMSMTPQSNVYLAQDSDFSGTSNGNFKYIGTEKRVRIPHVIKGVPVTSYKEMFLGTFVTYVESDNLNITSTNSMFGSLQSSTLDLSSFNTSSVTDMSYMFGGTSPHVLDLSSFDTSNVTNMTGMFSDSLSDLILTSFDTSNVTNMFRMFYNTKTTELDLSSFDTSNVTSMNLMFSNSQVTTLDLSKFDTSKVTDMSYMFSGAQATNGIARTQMDANKLNASYSKPSGLTFVAYELATDEDFEWVGVSTFTSGYTAINESGKGYYKYIGDKEYVIIPHEINGNPMTSYNKMFFESGEVLKGVKNDNPNVTDIERMFASTKATELDLNNFDTSSVNNLQGTFSGINANIIGLNNLNVSNVTNMAGVFGAFKGTEIDISNWDTGRVTDMSTMFGEGRRRNGGGGSTGVGAIGANNLINVIGLENLDTSNVTNMSAIFEGSKIKKLDLSNWNTSKVKGMVSMFSGSEATELNLSKLDTSNVTLMEGMFKNSKATNLDVSNFNTSNVTSMARMFERSPMTNLDLSSFDTSNVADMSWMFAYSQITELNLSNFDTSNVVNMRAMFTKSQISNLDLSHFDTSKVTRMDEMFNNSNTMTLNLRNFNTSNVTTMGHMFYGSQTTELDLSSFDTSNVTNVNYMFRDSQATIGYARTQADANKFNSSSNKPSGLIFNSITATDSDFSGTTNGNFRYIGTAKKVRIPHVIKGVPVTSYTNMFRGTDVEYVVSDNPNITQMQSTFSETTALSMDLSSLDTSNVTNMAEMFAFSNYTTLNLSSFDTSKVSDMAGMFWDSQVTSLDLSSFNTTNVTDMSYMFYGAHATTLDLSSFDTSKVTDMSNMFRGSEATSLDLSSFDTSNVTSMASMFRDSLATTLDLSSFNTSNVTRMSNMFDGAQATTLDLSSFDTSNVTDMSDMFIHSKATTLDLSSFDTSKVTNMSGMFCMTNVATLDLSSFDTSNVTNTSFMFGGSQATVGIARTQADATKLNASSDKPTGLVFTAKYLPPTITLSKTPTGETVGMVTINTIISDSETGIAEKRWGHGTVSIDDMRVYGTIFTGTSFKVSSNNTYTVYAKDGVGNEAVKTIEVKNILYTAQDSDFSGTTNGDFRYIGTETRLRIPHVIKGVPVTSYSSMFAQKWVEYVHSDNPNITDMRGMFENTLMETLDLRDLNTSGVIKMGDMFNSSRVKNLDLSNFDTGNVEDMSAMFANSRSETINLTSFDTSNVTNMSYMFDSNTTNTLDLSSFRTPKVRDMEGMFTNSGVSTLDLSSFDMSNVSYTDWMFDYSSLTSGIARTVSDADILNNATEYPEEKIFTAKFLPPVITINPYTTTPTNQNVVVTATTNKGTLNKTTHTFTGNGSFDFIAKDAYYPAGIKKTVTISNIDKTAPTITLSKTPTGNTNGEVTINTTITDNLSGVSEKKYLEGNRTASYMKTNGTTFTGTSFKVSANNTYTVYAKDRAGNESIKTIVINNIIKDPPTVQFITDGSSTAKKSHSTKINVTPTTGTTLGTLQYSWSASSTVPGTMTSFTNGANITKSDGDGNFYLHVSAMDNLGNVRNSVSKPFLLDNTPPTAPVLSSNNPNPTNSDVSITISYSGDSTIKQYKIDSGGWLTYTKPITISKNSTITARSTDAAGNVSAEGKLIVSNINKEPPVINIGGYSTLPTNQDVVVTATASKGTLNKTTHIFKDNGSFEFIATDTHGNVTKRTVTITHIDKVPPTTPTLTRSTSAQTNQNVSVTITYSADSDKKQYKVDNGSWISYTKPVSISSNSTIYARGIDLAGNMSGEGKLVVANIDKVKPVINLTAPTEFTNGNVLVTATVTDNVAISYKRWATGNRNIAYFSTGGEVLGTSFTATSNGVYTAYAKDTAGNETVKTITINNINKELPVITVPDYIKTPTNQNIVITPTVDSDTTLVPTTRTFTSNGSQKFVATNKWGSVSEVTVTINNIDKIKPNISLSAPTGPTNQNLTVTANITDNVGISIRKWATGDRTVSYFTSSGASFTTTFTAPSNGKYTVYAKDTAGNETVEVIDITNIDRVLPVITIPDYIKTPTNGVITITPTVTKGATLTPTAHTFDKNGTITFTAKDKWGNIAEPVKVTITNIVTDVPTIAFSPNGNTTPAKKQSTRVTGSATNPASINKMEYAWSTNTSTPSVGSFKTFTNATTLEQPSGNGNYYLHVKAYDNAGNTRTLVSNRFLLDNIAPTAPTFTISKSTPTNDNVKMTINFTADSNKKEYKLGSGAWTNYTGPVDISANQTILARGTDIAGNVSPNGSYSVTNIDKTAPPVPTLVSSNTGFTNKNLTVTITYPEDIGTSGLKDKEYRLGATGSWVTYSTPITITENVEIYARSLDRAGNTSLIGKLIVDNIDKVDPVITIPNYTTTPTNQDINIIPTATKGATISPSSYKFTSNGSKKFVATDKWGNTSEVTVTISNIVKTPPVINFVKNGNTTYAKSQGTVVNTSPTSPAKIISREYVWAANTAVPTTGWKTFTSNQNITINGITGDRYLHIKTKDDAGNESIAVSNVFKLDNTVPSDPTISYSGKVLENQTFKLGNLVDSHSGINKVTYKIGTATEQTYNHNTLPSIPITDKTSNIDLLIKVLDNAGNETTKIFKLNLPMAQIEVPIKIPLVLGESNNIKTNFTVKNTGTPIKLSLSVDQTGGIPLINTNMTDTDWRGLSKNEAKTKSQMILNVISGTGIMEPGYKTNHKVMPTKTELAKIKNGEVVYELGYYMGYARESTINSKYNFTFIADSMY